MASERRIPVSAQSALLPSNRQATQRQVVHLTDDHARRGKGEIADCKVNSMTFATFSWSLLAVASHWAI
jgi:hypothetical protein